MKYFLYFFFIACSNTCIQAQQLTYFPVTTYTNIITAIDDYLWIGNDNGLVQLDLEGNVIQHHSVANGLEYGYSGIDYITKDNKGDLYARAYTMDENENIVYQKKGNQWQIAKKYSQPHIHLLPFNDGHFGYYDSNKHCIFIQQKKGWVKKKAIIEWFVDRVEKEHIDPLILKAAAYIVEKEELWISSTEGIVKIDKQRKVRHYSFVENVEWLKDEKHDVNEIALDEKGGLHIAVRSFGFLDNNGADYKYYPTQDTFLRDTSLSKISIEVLLTNKEGKLQKISKYGDSIYHQTASSRWSYSISNLHNSSKRWRQQDEIKDATIDSNAIVWLVTHNGNLYQIASDSIQYRLFIDSLAHRRQVQFSYGEQFYTKENRTILIPRRGYLRDNILLLDTAAIEKSPFLLDDFTKKERSFFLAAFSSIVEQKEPLLQTLNTIVSQYHLDSLFDSKSFNTYAHYESGEDGFLIYTDNQTSTVLFPNGQVDTIEYDLYINHIEWSLYSRMEHIQDDNSFVLYNGDKLYHVFLVDTILLPILIDSSTSFPIQNPVRGIYADRNHNIWIQRTKAIHLQKDGVWRTFDLKTLGVKEKDLAFRSVFREDKAGNLLLLTRKGLLSWNGEEWSFELKWKGKMRRLHPEKFWLDEQGNIWLAMLRGGLYKINREYPNKAHVIDKGIKIEDLAIEKDTGVVWLLLGFSEGLCLYRP